MTRTLWLTVHRWIGLALLAVMIPIGLTGSVLVFRDAVDRVVNPQRHVADAAKALPLSAYARAGAAALPGYAPGEITLAPGQVVVALSRDTGKARPDRASVWLDPTDARVLDASARMTEWRGWMHRFHGSLLVPGAGRTIVGWIGWALFASAITGVILWWPRTASLARALRWSRVPRTTARLHHVAGFWIALPLAVVAFTGAYISFPKFVRGIERTVTGEAPSAPMVATPGRPVRLDVDAARARLPRGFIPSSVRFPDAYRNAWTFGRDGTALEVDAMTGDVRPAANAPGLARAMRQLHDGTGYALGWRLVLALAGLAPALLGVTGVVMWWRARRGRRTARHRPRPVVA